MKILIAIDSSVFAQNVVDEVISIAWPKNSEFTLLSVIRPCADAAEEEGFVKATEIILQQHAKYLKQHLHTAKVSMSVEVGNAAETILQNARLKQADMIVLGSHGDTGYRRDRVGSVAAAVVNQAPCTVELIKVVKEKAAQAVKA